MMREVLHSTYMNDYVVVCRFSLKMPVFSSVMEGLLMIVTPCRKMWSITHIPEYSVGREVSGHLYYMASDEI